MRLLPVLIGDFVDVGLLLDIGDRISHRIIADCIVCTLIICRGLTGGLFGRLICALVCRLISGGISSRLCLLLYPRGRIRLTSAAAADSPAGAASGVACCAAGASTCLPVAVVASVVASAV